MFALTVQRKFWFVVCVAACLGVGAKKMAIAQTLEANPKFEVGDKWTYRYHDKGNNKEPYLYLDQTYKVWSHSGYIYRKTENPAEQQINQTVWRYDYKRSGLKEWFLFNPKNPTTTGRRILDYQPDDDAIQLPLTVGKKYSITRPLRGRGAHIKYDVEVEAFEKVKVEAGELDAYRIKLAGWWYMTEVNPQLSGRTNEVMYFAPAAKRVIKYEHYSRSSNGGQGDTIFEELVKWEPKAALVPELIPPETAASAPKLAVSAAQ